MTEPKPTPYRELPDVQILSAANDYLTGFNRLATLLPETGVLYVALHSGAIAIELFLKAWSAQQVEVDDGEGLGVAVYAQPAGRIHLLVKLFEAAPTSLREMFARLCAEDETLSHLGGPEQVLDRLEGLFQASRYPYEAGQDIRRYRFDEVRACVNALGEASELADGEFFYPD
jgi:hypothetical protein